MNEFAPSLAYALCLLLFLVYLCRMRQSLLKKIKPYILCFLCFACFLAAEYFLIMFVDCFRNLETIKDEPLIAHCYIISALILIIVLHATAKSFCKNHKYTRFYKPTFRTKTYYYHLFYSLITFGCGVYTAIFTEKLPLGAFLILVGSILNFRSTWWFFVENKDNNLFGLHDDEIDEKAKDQLARGLEFDRLAKWIKEKSKNGRGCALGILGPWGSGKTFLIHYLQRELKKIENPYRFVELNLWQCKNEHELYLQTNQALESAYFGTPSPLARLGTWAHRLLAHGLARFDLAHLISGSCSFFASTQCNAFCTMMNDQRNKRNVVLVLDNLERTSLDIMHVVFPLVERLRSIPGLTILLSMADNNAHVENPSLSEFDYKRICSTVHKLAEYVYNMPCMNQQCAQAILKDKLKSQAHIPALCSLHFDTPRQFFRMADKLRLFEKVSQNINQYPSCDPQDIAYDVTFYTMRLIYAMLVIQLFYPPVYTFFHQNTDEFTQYKEPFQQQRDYTCGELIFEKSEINNYTIRENASAHVTPYIHEQLFCSAIEILREKSAKAIIGLIENTNSKLTHIATCVIIDYLNKQPQSTFENGISSICFDYKDSDDDVVSIANCAIGILGTITSEDSEEEAYNVLNVIFKAYNFLSPKNKIAEYDKMIYYFNSVHVLSYCLMNNKINELKSLCTKLTMEARAALYDCIDSVETLRNKEYAKNQILSDANRENLIENISKFDDLKNELYSDYEKVNCQQRAPHRKADTLRRTVH